MVRPDCELTSHEVGASSAVLLLHLHLQQDSRIVQELCESRLRWPSWAVRPNEPSGFCGRKAILNHASALVSACP